jgi:hypothetical protein
VPIRTARARIRAVMAARRPTRGFGRLGPRYHVLPGMRATYAFWIQRTNMLLITSKVRRVLRETPGLGRPAAVRETDTANNR